MNKTNTSTEQILLKTDMTLDQSADQSHIIFRFFVPDRVEKLVIDLSYDPPYEEYDGQVKDWIKDHSDYYDFHIANHPQAVEKVYPLKNLLTISVDDPAGFRGSCHRFQPVTKIEMGNGDSTPGMSNGEIISGMWNIMINCHAIVSQKCLLHIQVKGVFAGNATTRWYHQPFKELPFPIRKTAPSREINNGAHRWVKSEIHTHTNHSDGSQTVTELVRKAEELGIECLAITDHNTMSAIDEWDSSQQNSPITIVKGIEWTTFYGHLLTLGYEKITSLNWSLAGPLTLKQHIQEIKEEKAIAGIAHPFRPGSPFCTGCHWEYAMTDLELIDFIEVWNGENPHTDKFNQKAFTLWTNLLNQGHQIAATTGRDWHHSETYKLFSSLYLFLPDNFTANDVKAAITSGHSYISLQPKMNFVVNEEFVPGDQIIRSEHVKLELFLEISDTNEQCTVVIDSNCGELFREKSHHVNMNIDSLDNLLYIRTCIYGANNKLIAFSNPIYIVDDDGEA